MKYYLRTNKDVIICLISDGNLLSKLFNSSGKWVSIKLINGKTSNCFQFNIEPSIFGIGAGLEIIIDNDYYLQPIND